jgi:hypothetical protein
MIKLKNLLGEAKQVGLLYHFTSLDSLKRIVEEDLMRGSWGNSDLKGKYISVTRDKNLYKNYPNLGAEELHLAIVFDGDKLSNKYKIRPYMYEPYRDLDKFSSESEELIMLPNGVLPNVSHYMLGVMPLPSSFSRKEKQVISFLTKANVKVL